MYNRNIEHKLPVSMEEFARQHNLPMWTVYDQMRKGLCNWPYKPRARVRGASYKDTLARALGISYWTLEAHRKRGTLKNIAAASTSTVDELYGLTISEFRQMFSHSRLQVAAIMRNIEKGTVEDYINYIEKRAKVS